MINGHLQQILNRRRVSATLQTPTILGIVSLKPNSLNRYLLHDHQSKCHYQERL